MSARPLVNPPDGFTIPELPGVQTVADCPSRGCPSAIDACYRLTDDIVLRNTPRT